MGINISAICLDTSAFHKNICDFAGISSSLIPKLSASIKRIGAVLLAQPVLLDEIRGHVNSTWKEKEQEAIQALVSNHIVFQQIGLDTDNVKQDIQKADILNAELNAFNEFFKEATILPYPNPETVFRKYFATQAPFEKTGKKKDEFPDAFIIESILDYLGHNSSDTILVVTTDSDWEKAFAGNKQVKLVKDIREALRQINGSVDFAYSILMAARENLVSFIIEEANNVYFIVPDYDISDMADFSSVEVKSIEDIAVLEVSDEKILIQFSALIIVGGEFSFLDENDSAWDEEEKEYVFTSFSMLTFENAKAEIKCEASFDLSSPSSPEMISFKILPDGKNEIELDEEQIEVCPVRFDVADYEAEQMDIIEEYYKHTSSE